MKFPLIVLDANIAVKILHDEPDSDRAQGFLEACVQHRSRLLVPEHFVYELMNVCRRLDVEIANAWELYDGLKDSILTSVSPQKSTWLLAEKITRQGHPKSGFPSMYDSIYHALALEAEGVFVTADARHIAKAQSFGSVKVLADWEGIFAE